MAHPTPMDSRHTHLGGVEEGQLGILGREQEPHQMLGSCVGLLQKRGLTVVAGLYRWMGAGRAGRGLTVQTDGQGEGPT